MKKCIAIFLIMMAPFSVSALDTIYTDEDLNGVVAQAGLSLTTVGNNVVTEGIHNLAWGDGNGHVSAATAGHLRIDGHVTIGWTVSGTLLYDVASTGIRIGMPATNSIAVTFPTSLRLSCMAGASATWATTPTDASTVTFGNLGVQTISITITSPTAWIIKPH